VTERWTVDAAAAGLRLDKFLAADGRLGSRRRAAEALARRKVFLNGREATGADGAKQLAPGDEVRLWIDRPGTSKRPQSIGEARDLRIVYEDDDLVVVDKPAGVLAVPLARREDARSVYEDLKAHLARRGRRRVYVVHRIDRDTSGLVVFAKSARAQEELKAQFKRHEPERTYVAIVYGRVRPAAGTWRDRLVWDEQSLVQKETHPRDPRGKEAISEYRVVESFRDTSLIEVRLHTGKRNQIRLQARLRGHTLVGEKRYTFGPEETRPLEFPRQALHAARLAFGHPRDGRVLRFDAPVPADMAGLISRLRGQSSRSFL
jgi:23S rRNA pseudouridine1911/1915/1917 synthase